MKDNLMNSTKQLLALISIVGLISCASAMEEQPVSHFIKIQDIPKDELVFADHQGGKIENGQEYFDAQGEDPISYVSFNDLILARAPYGAPYILAVVAYKQQQPPAIRHTYYDAATINEILFGTISMTKSQKNRRVFKYAFNKNNAHPATRAPIDSVTYIAIDPISKAAKVIGTSRQMQEGSPLEQQAFTRLFHESRSFNQELEGGKNPKTLKDIARKIK